MKRLWLTHLPYLLTLLALAAGLALPVAAEDLAARHPALVRAVAGLRQTLFEGSAEAAGRVIRWTDKLALDDTASALRSSLGLASPPPGRHAAGPLAAFPAAAGSTAAGLRDLPSRGTATVLRALGGLSLMVDAGRDVASTLGHASPSLGLATAGQPSLGLSGSSDSTSAARTGRSVTEQSLVGHEINVAVPVPAIPWAQLSAGRYWWGAADLMPEVRGARTGLKLTPLPLVEVEGGRMQDNARGAGAYLSARLRIPLD
jgi:hypothetical protein